MRVTIKCFLILMVSGIVMTLVFPKISSGDIDAKKETGLTPEAKTEKSAGEQSLEGALLELKQRLDNKEEGFRKKERALRLKEQQLMDREALLKKQIGDYEKIITRLQDELKEKRKMSEDRIQKFRQVYEKMDPKKSAKIFDKVDAELAADILSLLKQKSVAEIMNKMDPMQAKRITEIFLKGRSPATD